jgi:hypothetical protein
MPDDVVLENWKLERVTIEQDMKQLLLAGPQATLADRRVRQIQFAAPSDATPLCGTSRRHRLPKFLILEIEVGAGMPGPTRAWKDQDQYEQDREQ